MLFSLILDLNLYICFYICSLLFILCFNFKSKFNLVSDLLLLCEYDAKKELLCELFKLKDDSASQMVSHWASVTANPDVLICTTTKELISFDIEEETKQEALKIESKKRGNNIPSKKTVKQARDLVLRKRNEIIKKNLLVAIDTKRPYFDNQNKKWTHQIDDGQATCELCVFEVLLDEIQCDRAPIVFETSMMDDTQDFAKNCAYFFTRNELNNSNENSNDNKNSYSDKRFTLNICDISCDVMIDWIGQIVEKYTCAMEIDNSASAKNDDLSVSMADRDTGIILPNDNADSILPDLPNMCSVFNEIKQTDFDENSSPSIEYPLVIINENEWNLSDEGEKRRLFMESFANQLKHLL